MTTTYSTKMRDAGDKLFAAELSRHVADATPILFCKHESGYVEATYWPTRRDFVRGAQFKRMGGMSLPAAKRLAAALAAALVEF